MQLLVQRDLPVHVDAVVTVLFDQAHHIPDKPGDPIRILQQGKELLLPAEAQQYPGPGGMRLFDHGGRERHLASLLQVVELRGIGVNGILRPVEIQPGPLRRSHQVDELEGIVPRVREFRFAQEALHRIGGMYEVGDYGGRFAGIRCRAGDK